MLTRIGFFIMVNHHPRVFDIPLKVAGISLNRVLHGSRYLLLFFLEQYHLVLHQGLFIRQGIICQDNYRSLRWMRRVDQIYGPGVDFPTELPGCLSFNNLWVKKILFIPLTVNFARHVLKRGFFYN